MRLSWPISSAYSSCAGALGICRPLAHRRARASSRASTGSPTSSPSEPTRCRHVLCRVNHLVILPGLPISFRVVALCFRLLLQSNYMILFAFCSTGLEFFLVLYLFNGVIYGTMYCTTYSHFSINACLRSLLFQRLEIFMVPLKLSPKRKFSLFSAFILFVLIVSFSLLYIDENCFSNSKSKILYTRQ